MRTQQKRCVRTACTPAINNAGGSVPIAPESTELPIFSQEGHMKPEEVRQFIRGGQGREPIEVYDVASESLRMIALFAALLFAALLFAAWQMWMGAK